ncbi:MAG TPA: transcriptional regulator [bacterium]|nr:transcriptional regulator [bacterium]
MNKQKELIRYLKNRGGIAGYAEIRKAGFDKTALRKILETKQAEKMERGVYRLAGGMTCSNPDFAAVSIKVPKGVICLLSALFYHGLTDEIPRNVDVAIPRGSHVNKIKYPPVHFYHFSNKAWREGVEKHVMDGHEIKIYSAAKTIADAFKFRNKIGIPIARQAMKAALRQKRAKPDEIIRYAKICRVDKTVQPILEALLGQVGCRFRRCCLP